VCHDGNLGINDVFTGFQTFHFATSGGIYHFYFNCNAFVRELMSKMRNV